MISKAIRNSFVALFLTLSVYSVLIWFIWDSYRYLKNTDRNYSHIIELKGSIAHLDEVLSMAAQMAAATGDSKWEQRYRKYEPELDKILKEILVTGARYDLARAVNKTSRANEILVEMENRAFRLIHEGKLQLAANVINSPEYHKNKAEYREGLDHITESVSDLIQQRVSLQKKEGYLTLGFVILTLPVLIMVWIYTIRQDRIYKQRLTSLNQKLNAINHSKDKLFSIIAHDLKSPFLGLLGLSQILADPEANLPIEKMRHISGKLHESLVQVNSLINTLLEWSRLQRGSIKINPSPVHLHNLILESVKQHSVTISKKNITVTDTIVDNSPVLADPDLISTVFRNILSNAIKFTPANGVIHLSSEHSDGFHKITVTDNGVGIPASQLADIFRIDTVQSSPGTEGEKGTGLGLILCKEFLDLHKGKMEITSTVDHGTSVTIMLPG